MQKKLIVAIIALIGLGSLAVLGSSPEFVHNLVETVRNSALGRAFSAPDQPLAARETKPVGAPSAPNGEPAGDIPDTVLWPMLFKFTKGLESEAQKPSEFAGTADLYNNYFTRQGKLPARTDAALKETAARFMEELAPLNEKARTTIERERAKFKDERSIRKSAPPQSIVELQRQHDELTLRYRDEFRKSVGDEAFNEFSTFLKEEFSKGARKVRHPDTGDGDSLSPQFFIGFSWIIWDDGLVIPLITGFGGTAVDFFDGFYYDPAAISELYNWTTNGTLHIGGDRGHAWLYPALVIHPVYATIRTHWYCTYTEHYAVDRFIFLREENKVPQLPGARPATGADWLTAPEDYYYLGYTQVCHQVQSQCDGVTSDSCQEPTPTPTPSPTPIEIKTVGFTGDHTVVKHTTGAVITDPTWTRGSSTNAENVVAYTKDTSGMKMDASFDVNPAPPAGDSISVKVQAKYNGQVIAATANNTSVTQSTFTVTNLQIDRTKLESTAMVKKGTYTFNWEVTVDNGQTWRAAGNSSHIIYWTYADPVEPANCATDGVPRNCMFTAGRGNGGSTGNANEYPGLYDYALEYAITGLSVQEPADIAKQLASKIDHDIVYDPNFTLADNQHPLRIPLVHHKAQCSANANLLQGLLRSLGINSDVVYFWGGRPDNPETPTGGKVHVYHWTERYPDLDHKVTLRAKRPKKNSGGESIEKDPHFTFHSMVRLGTKYYDPSYGEDIFGMQGYPFSDATLIEILSFKDNNPSKPRFKKNEDTAPFVVKALTMEKHCIPSSTNSNCSAFPDVIWAQNEFCDHSDQPAVDPWIRTSNFDTDSISDFAVWRPSNATWYIVNSFDQSLSYYTYGVNGDKPVPADYDGDGITDYALYRPSNGTWYYRRSSDDSFVQIQYGIAEDRPVQGDFDGDGKSDIAVWRPSTGVWYWIHSSDGSFHGLTYGLSGDVPVSGDYDGDRKTDFALYRPSAGTWYILNSSNLSYSQGSFGISEDIPVTGDFDHDHKADIAVYRPSTGVWYISQSTAGFTAFQFGSAGDIPSTGDFNNDGGVDPVVWSPSTGTWRVLNLENGSVIQAYWGAAGDVPIPAAYNR